MLQNQEKIGKSLRPKLNIAAHNEEKNVNVKSKVLLLMLCMYPSMTMSIYLFEIKYSLSLIAKRDLRGGVKNE